MKLTILGTGNAIVTKCYNTCFVISEGRNHFLVDGGGGNCQIVADLGGDFLTAEGCAAGLFQPFGQPHFPLLCGGRHPAAAAGVPQDGRTGL